jgi:copper ion binding protein
MRRIFSFLAALVMSVSVWAAGTTDTLVVRIKGMRCEECAHKVRDVLRKNEGIGRIGFNLERRTAAIAYDPQLICADTIKAKLAATGRYKTTPYDPSEVIRRGIGLHISDMHCDNCARRIVKRLETMEGIDSLAPHVDKHYVFIRYDANRTCKAAIREAIGKLGYTPVSYYSSKDISFAYFNIPAEAVNEETIDQALALDGVDDANVNARQKSLAITFINTETTAEKLISELKAAGIAAVVPAPHECKEK